MPDPAAISPRNKEFRLLMASVLYFLGRAAVVGFVFAVPALYFLRGHVEMPLVLGGAGAVALLFVLYYLAASGLRCAACSNPVLMDNGTRKHPHAKRLPGLSHRAKVAWDILFKTNYQCMYCNTRCRCRKSWSGGHSGAGAPVASVRQGSAGGGEMFPESVFSSVFGGMDPVNEADAPAVGRFPESEMETAAQEDVPRKVTERVVTPGYKPATIFPSERTVPLTVLSDEDGPRKETKASLPEPEVSQDEEVAGKLMPWELPVRSRSTSSAAMELKEFHQPKPAPAAEAHIIKNDPPAMNYTSPERHNAATPANPFLAAAAAQPPPPSPILPAILSRQPQAEPAPAFPPPGNASNDGPPPWTLPAAARPSQGPVVITAPVLPIIPDTAATLARKPKLTTAPIMPPPAPPAPVGSPVAAAPVIPPAQSVPAALLSDVLGVLEEGQRSIAGAFQSIIQKLEFCLNTAAASAARVPQPAEPAPVPSVPAPAPVVPEPVAVPSVAAAAVLPALIPPPAPVVAPPVMAEAPVFMQATPAPIPAPVPVQAAPPEMTEAEAPAAAPARRRFVRPNGQVAQSLSSALEGAFAPPAPAANGNGHPEPPAVVDSPFTYAPPQPMPQAPPVRQAAYVPPPVDSPFALAAEPLTPSSQAAPPAPFTFLHPNGEGQFAPHTAPSAAATYDALEDTPLPWMQPVGSRR